MSYSDTAGARKFTSLMANSLLNNRLNKIDIRPLDIDNTFVLFKQAAELLRENVTVEVEACVVLQSPRDCVGKLSRMCSGKDDLTNVLRANMG